MSTCALALMVFPGVATAVKQTDVRYRYEQVWSATVRLVRVDLECAIKDRDEDIGYLLFTYRDHGRDHSGSVELVRTTDERGDIVRIKVSIGTMPAYIEQMILDKLERKLQQEFGDPPSPPSRRPPAEPRPDEGEGEDPN